MEITEIKDSITTIQKQLSMQDWKPNAAPADIKIDSEPPSSREQKQKPKIDNLEEIFKELNKYVEVFNTKLSFSVDENTGRTVIKIINRDTGELIRQVPPEEMLKVLSKITEMLGLLIDKKV